MRETALILFFTLLAVFSGIAQERRALVIGIGQYEDSKWGHIHGDADVDYALEMLRANGFTKVQTLRNSEATKAAILSAFSALERSCSTGDRVYIHFSGHGQQITDLDGDEKDGYDEAWIPYDAHPYYSKSYKGEKHLVDDEVNRKLSGIKQKIGPSGRLLVVVDACHSGGATRDPADSLVSRGYDKKFEIPGKKPKPIPPLKEEWVTISACQPFQINWELAKPAVGILTWCLYCLRDMLGKLTNDQLKASITSIMLENPGKLEQTPMMSGKFETESVKELFE